MRYLKAGLGAGIVLATGLALVAHAPRSFADKADQDDKAQAVRIDHAVSPFTLWDTKGPLPVGDWGTEGRHATVLIFVSTHCPFSNGYNERMAALAQSFSPRGVRFVGINSNKAETAAMAAAHATKNHLGFPVLKDPRNKVADVFGAKVTPEAFVVDAGGVLRYHGNIDNSLELNEVKDHNLETALTALLGGKAVPVKQTLAFGCSIKRVNE